MVDFVAVLEVVRVVVELLLVVVIVVVEVVAVSESVYDPNLTETPDLTKFGLKERERELSNKFKNHVIPGMIYMCPKRTCLVIF